MRRKAGHTFFFESHNGFESFSEGVRNELMGKKCQVQVGDVSIEIAASEAVGSMELGVGAHAELTGDELLALGVVAERVMWRLQEAWLNNRGGALRESLVACDGTVASTKEVATLLLETFSGGEEIADGTSASQWFLTWIHENQQRPELVIQLLSELHARRASVREFFLASVYSNSEHIGAILHFLDYQRALQRSTEDDCDKAALAQAMLSDLRYELGIRESSDSEQQLWEAFEQERSAWTYEDLIALQRLSQAIRSRREFFAIASLALSLRPLALFHFWRCLSLDESNPWGHVVTTDRRYAAESLDPCYRFMTNCFAGLCRQFGVVQPPPVERLSIADIQAGCEHLPIATDGRVARVIIEAISGAVLSPADCETLSSAFSYLIAPHEIQREASGKSLV